MVDVRATEHVQTYLYVSVTMKKLAILDRNRKRIYIDREMSFLLPQ